MTKRALGLCHGLSLIMAILLSYSTAPSHAEGTEARVSFLTLRNVARPDEPGMFFAERRGELRAGWCMVRETDVGGLEPIVDSAPSFLREQLLFVDSVRVLETDDMLDSFQDGLGTPPPALFVHGYFIDFEKGCRRASLLQKNAGLKERLLWFSWPSDGDIANYARDEADLYWSVPDLASTIIELHSRTGVAGKVDVLGHSLGARGVVYALQEVAHRRPDIRLGEVVLLAPDVDFEIFVRLFPKLSEIAEGITVYVNEEDKPLDLSEQLHGYPRLGQSGNDVSALSGLEVIDLSGLPNQSPSGHLYHIHNRRVGEDLDLLLNGRERAAQRPNLVSKGPNTWRMLP